MINMLLRELIDQTVRYKDEAKQRRTIVQMAELNLKEDLRALEGRHKEELNTDRLNIEQETDFKEKGMTNQKQRDTYIAEMQKAMKDRQADEIYDLKYHIEQAQTREKELWDEYKYYEDRLAMLMKIYDIEGEIEVENTILAEREIIQNGVDDDEPGDSED